MHEDEEIGITRQLLGKDGQIIPTVMLWQALPRSCPPLPTNSTLPTFVVR